MLGFLTDTARLSSYDGLHLFIERSIVVDLHRLAEDRSVLSCRVSVSFLLFWCYVDVVIEIVIQGLVSGSWDWTSPAILEELIDLGEPSSRVIVLARLEVLRDTQIREVLLQSKRPLPERIHVSCL